MTVRSVAARTRLSLFALLVLAAASGCSGEQSALAPAGRSASRIADLFWVMTIGAAVIWLAVTILTLVGAYFPRARGLTRRSGRILVVGGGVILPVIVLTALLTQSLYTLPEFLAPAPDGALVVQVTGYQWWWRVRYPAKALDSGPAPPPIELANEIHVPVGMPVDIELDSADVIHSFWVPSLGGKVDMIPGHRTRLRLEPTKTGTYRGVCAEYCGTSHALMAFYFVVEERDAFDRWLAEQAKPAAPATTAAAIRGEEAFVGNGCGACHTVRGARARGTIAPDLTHVGGRVSIGAGILATEPNAFHRWITRTSEVKPSVHMPSFGMLAKDDLDALVAYLEGLK